MTLELDLNPPFRARREATGWIIVDSKSGEPVSGVVHDRLPDAVDEAVELESR